MSFSDFKLSKEILSQIEKMGFITPTPIQKEAIPVALEGKDIMGLAQTGTGKTAAFALPILNRLLEGPKGEIRALIIAPTRELAEQINDAINMMGKQTGLRSTPIYGGVSSFQQSAILRRGVEIVVACPGRLLDHLMTKTIRLDHLEVLVLDEADHMFDMGFLPTIKRVLKYANHRKQTMLFSATMPRDIMGLAKEVLHNPVHLEVAHQEKLKAIEHAIYPVRQHLKTDLLFEVLKTTDTKSILIFTRTKHRAKMLDEKLQRRGYKATSLQGNLSQNRRQEALDGFRSGKYQIMVATDIAARGIDVSQISHVINYDMPDTVEAYTHRIGRTGRAERSGDAFTFVTNDDNNAVHAIESKMGEKIKRIMVDNFNYNEPPRVSDTPPRPPRRNFYRR